MTWSQPLRAALPAVVALVLTSPAVSSDGRPAAPHAAAFARDVAVASASARFPPASPPALIDTAALAEPAGLADPDAGFWGVLPPPGPRVNHCAIHDPVRGRMVVFGGRDYADMVRNDTWEMSLTGAPLWRELHPAGAPPPANPDYFAAYDAAGDRMVVFHPRLPDRVWFLALAGPTEWSVSYTTGASPASRELVGITYDPGRRRILMFGGMHDYYEPLLNDVWALDISEPPAWAHLIPGGEPPAGRLGSSAIYDPARDRMVVFGGYYSGTQGAVFLNDTWALSFGEPPAWMQLLPAGPLPDGGMQQSATYDSARDQMVIFGGISDQPSRYRDETWTLSLQPSRYRDETWTLSLGGAPAWTRVAPAGEVPPGRLGHSFIYDAGADRFILFGGGPTSFYWIPSGDTWELRLGDEPRWTLLYPHNSTPWRYGHVAVLDPRRDALVVFGGDDGVQASNACFRLTLDGNPVWSTLDVIGTSPSRREWAAGVYDPRRERMIVFGGATDADLFAETWALALAGPPTWELLAPAGQPPPARYGHTAVYDPVGDRVIVFGGFDGHQLGDVWALSLAEPPTWTALSPAGAAPPPRYFHAAVYDSRRHAMLVFGGDGEGPLYLDDVWSLDLSGAMAWSQLSPSGTSPGPRVSHAADYDPVRDRMVVFGGWDGAQLRNDVWALVLGEAPRWTALAPDGGPPPGAESHVVVYDAARDRLLTYGGYLDSRRSDVWTLTWGAPVAVPEVPATGGAGLSLRTLPNPFRGVATIRYELPAGGRVTLEVFDVVGRRVRRIEANAPRPGSHGMTWDGRDGGGRPVPPGIYLLRLAAGGSARTARAVLLP